MQSLLAGTCEVIKTINDTRNSTKVKIARRTIKVDRLMANLIKAINHTSLKTLACCSGHGKYQITIVVKRLNGNIMELISGISIPRKKRFYVKDKEGFYYIPETIRGDQNRN